MSSQETKSGMSKDQLERLWMDLEQLAMDLLEDFNAEDSALSPINRAQTLIKNLKANEE